MKARNWNHPVSGSDTNLGKIGELEGKNHEFCLGQVYFKCLLGTQGETWDGQSSGKKRS